MTTMAIGSTTVTTDQLHGMLGGNIKEATHLEGWEAFKNFFMKLLNHLNIGDDCKEKQLRDIYDRINGTDSKSKDTLLPVLENITNLTKLLPEDVVKSMNFKFSQSEDKNKLTIFVKDKTLPAIELPNTRKNELMVASVKERLMEETRSSGVFQLKTSILSADIEKNGCAVIDLSTLETTYGCLQHAIGISENLDSANTVMQKQVTNNTDLGYQTEHLKMHREMQEQLTSVKNDLPGEFQIYIAEINRTIGDLKSSEQTLQTQYQELNSKWVDKVVKASSQSLQSDGGHLSKNTIDDRLAKHQQYVDGKDNLFTQDSLRKLERMTTQLQLLSETARVHELSQNRADFPLVELTQLNERIDSARVQDMCDPLTSLLFYHITVLNKLTPGYETILRDTSLINESTGDFTSRLAVVENSHKAYYDNQQNEQEHVTESHESLLTMANALPDTTLKTSLISRATVADMQNQIIRSLEQKFNAAGELVKNPGILDADLNIVFSELRNLNEQLPTDVPRKGANQEAIESLYSQAIKCKFDAWTNCIATVPVAHGETASTNVQKLKEFKKELEGAPINRTEAAKISATITQLTTQHQKTAAVETQLHNYMSNPYIAQKQIDQLAMQSGNLPYSERTVKINQDIEYLKDIKHKLASITAKFANVKNDITAIGKNNAVYTDSLTHRFKEIASAAQALPTGEPKKSLLAQIVAEEENLNKVKVQDEKFAEAGKILDTVKKNPQNNNVWLQALDSLKQNAVLLSLLPEGTKKEGLGKRFGNDIATATGLYKYMLSRTPGTGAARKPYLEQVTADGKLLKDMISRHQSHLPNADELLGELKSIKKENALPDRPISFFKTATGRP